MSDTKITPEERQDWRERLESPISCHDAPHRTFTLRLLTALEAAEARAEKAEANVALLTKGWDWLANKLIYCPPEFTNCAVDCAECRKEAARRAVADADSEVKG